MLEYLKNLCSLYGASGRENAVRDYIISEIRNNCDDYRIDNMGNLIVFKKGKNTPQNKVMLEAHMDEVGMIITDITDDGYLKFSFVGGVNEAVAVGRDVLVGEKLIHSVTGLTVMHLVHGDDEKKIPSADKMYIDIGAESKDEAEQRVSLGDYAYFDSDFVEFGDGYIKARALDNRVGCAMLMKLIGSELKYDTHFAFTVQEETGLVGAVGATYAVNPDYAIVVETTTAADICGVDGADRVCVLGNGAVVSFMDGRTIYNRELYNRAMTAAIENGIKAQTKTRVAGGNDAAVICRSRCGVKVLAISVPCRYLHSPSCVIKSDDLQDTLKLVSLMSESFAEN